MTDPPAPSATPRDEPRPEPPPLDLQRAVAEPAAMPAGRWRRSLPAGLAGSLAVHLLPLLLLVHGFGARPEIAPPIPVQVVFRPPPAPPVPKPPEPEKTRPSGRLASEDIGNPDAKPDRVATGEAAEKPPEPAAPKLVSALADPVAPAETLTSAPLAPPVKEAATARLPANPRAAPHAEARGPAASRDAYLAYCKSLILQHLRLLSPAFLAGRRGATELQIRVLDDGTIAGVAVSRGSSYPDVDARIEAAVAAVRRFPPLPQRFQGPHLDLTLQVPYPEGL